MAADTLPISRWILRGRRRSLVLWAIAVVAVSAMYIAFYPSMANEDMESLIAGLPEALRSGMGWDAIATGAGYLRSTVYGLLAPALMLVFGISQGAELVAGEEEAGTLELESASPVSRTSAVLQRFGALALQVAVLTVALGVATLVLAPTFDMGIEPAGIIAATAGLWLLVLAMASIAFGVGAATGSRSTALGAGAGVAVVSYIANAIAPSVSGAEWLEQVSPFGWYLAGEPLVAGFDVVGSALLVALTVAFVVLGVVVHGRRDLRG